MFDGYSLYIIGNGFSINCVKKLEEWDFLPVNAIDLSNLFSKGDSVPLEAIDGCYLSKRQCPHLWALGARSTIDSKFSAKIINNIISSYVLYLKKCDYRNKFSTQEASRPAFDKTHESVQTYYELNCYLKMLFIFYDKMLQKALRKLDKKSIDDFPIIKGIKAGDTIVSYNYDILLERLLEIAEVEYRYILKEDDASSDHVNIFKPHGSINFETKIDIPNIYDLKPDQIDIVDTLQRDGRHSLIIPPTGFVVGQEGSWVRSIRECLSKILINNVPDKSYIFGLSYDVVDREEINEILCCLNKNTTQIFYINPHPSPSLDYIITQHFDFYYHLKNICEQREEEL